MGLFSKKARSAERVRADLTRAEADYNKASKRYARLAGQRGIMKAPADAVKHHKELVEQARERMNILRDELAQVTGGGES